MLFEAQIMVWLLRMSFYFDFEKFSWVLAMLFESLKNGLSTCNAFLGFGKIASPMPMLFKASKNFLALGMPFEA